VLKSVHADTKALVFDSASRQIVLYNNIVKGLIF